jgi:hypothetical protein
MMSILDCSDMRPIERQYKDFCGRIAKVCEDEANRYNEDPHLQDADRQFIRVLREKCRQWKQEIQRLDDSYSTKPRG